MWAVITRIKYRVDNQQLLVHLYGRSETGSRICFVLKDSQPHFYVPVQERVPQLPEVLGVEKGYKSLFGDELKRVNVKYPFDVPKVRDGLDHYEADIIYEDRIRYDYGIKGQVEIGDNKVTPLDTIGTIQPRIAYVDIEVDNSKGGWTPDVAAGEILSIAIYDPQDNQAYILLNTQPHPARNNFPDVAPGIKAVLDAKEFKDYKVRVLLCPHEKDLLQKYDKYLNSPRAPDVLVAWNGWKYDYPYIEARYKVHNMKYDMTQACFDYMYGYGTLHRTQHGELESNALQSCASKELGTGKLDLTEPIYQVYRNDVATFAAYNLVDTILMHEMEKKLSVFRFYQTLSEIPGVPLDSINMSTKVVENMVFFLLRGTRVVLPSRPEAMKGNEYMASGADVLEPSKGVFDNVVVFDLKGEYPNIMRSFNISPETIFKTENPAFDHYKLPAGENTVTCKSPRGVLPRILDDMMRHRDEMKKEMKKHAKGTPEYDFYFSKQEAFKWVMNSVSGVLNNLFFRLANRLLYNNVTMIGRLHLNWTADRCKEMGYKVLYGDTDSVLVQMDGKDTQEIIAKAYEVEAKLNASYQDFIKEFNATESLLHVDVKKLYSKWFQGGKKKRYAGIIVWDGGKNIDPLMDITGFDAKRTSTPDWARRVQKELIWRMLTEDKAAVEKWLRDCYIELQTGKVPIEDLGIPIRMNQNQYKGNPIHYRAVMYSNQHLDKRIGAGDKIKYYYVKSVKGKPSTNIVAFDVDEKVPAGIDVNIDEHIRRCFILPLGPILECVGIDINKITSKHRTASLEDYE